MATKNKPPTSAQPPEELDTEERLATELSGSRALQRLSTRLIGEQSPEALYDQILDTALELMRADAVSIQLLEDGGKRLRRVATRNLHPDSTEYWSWVDASHVSTCGQALSKNERVIVEDVEASPELAGTGDLEAFRASGTRAVQSTPLLTRTGRPIGMISTHWRSPRRIDERDFGLFDILARQVADLFERSRAEAALRESDERQAFLLALGDAMRAESTAEAKIAVAARLLGEKLDASRVLYAEYDHDQGLAYIFNGWLADGAAPFPLVLKLEDFEGEALDDLREGRLVRIDDVGRLGAESGYAAIAKVGVQALLSPPLLVDGKLKFNVSVHQQEPRHWSDDEVTLVREVSERLWAEIVRTRAEDALRISEEKYRVLFDTIDSGYALIDNVRDEEGRVVDLFGVDFNRSYTQHSGLPPFAGRRASEVITVEPEWLRQFEEVTRTGIPARYENYIAERDRWVSTHYSLVGDLGSDRVAVVFDDVTDRKRAMEALRESEERQAFLLKLSDTIRPLADAAEIQAATTGLLGAHLGADRAMYAEVEGPRGAETGTIHGQYLRPADAGETVTAPFPDQFTYRDYGEHRMATRYRGDLLVVSDIEADPEADAAERANWKVAGVSAAVVAPLVKGGRLVAELGVHCTSPRAWTNAELALVREVAERTWAAVERAGAEGALRESEDRLQLLVGELQHRVRNILTVIRSIFSRTVETGTSVEEVAEHFRGRLDALGRTQTIVAQSAAGAVDLERLIRDELLSVGAADSARAKINGPEVKLSSKQAELIGLAVHELTTNSIKYGALSHPLARVEICWKTDIGGSGQPGFCLEWREHGVEMGFPSERRFGFGRELIEEALPYRLGARTRLEFGERGIACTISLPLWGGDGAERGEQRDFSDG